MHACTLYVCMNACMNLFTNTLTHTHKHTDTQAPTQSHTQAHIQAETGTHTDIQTDKNMNIHTNTHTNTHTHKHTAGSHTGRNTQAETHRHTHTQTHTHTHREAHTGRHTQAHTYTDYTHTLTILWYHSRSFQVALVCDKNDRLVLVLCLVVANVPHDVSRLLIGPTIGDGVDDDVTVDAVVLPHIRFLSSRDNNEAWQREQRNKDNAKLTSQLNALQ